MEMSLSVFFPFSQSVTNKSKSIFVSTSLTSFFVLDLADSTAVHPEDMLALDSIQGEFVTILSDRGIIHTQKKMSCQNIFMSTGTFFLNSTKVQICEKPDKVCESGF